LNPGVPQGSPQDVELVGEVVLLVDWRSLSLSVVLATSACRCAAREPAPDWIGTVQVAEPRRPLRGWRLVRGDGSPFTERDLVGRTSVVFVGYSRCPDVCPNTLSLLGGLDPGTDVQLVFLSVDPEHDARTLDGYTRFFDERIVGVTGTRDAIDHAVTQLGAAYTFRDGLVDHSTSLFVVDGNANVAGFVLRPSSPEAIRRDIEALRSRQPPRVRAELVAPATPPGAPGVVYGTLRAAAPSTLTGLTSPDVDRVELHRTVRTATMAGMQPVATLDLGPDAAVELAPGALHLMLLGDVQRRPPLIELAFTDGPTALVIPAEP